MNDRYNLSQFYQGKGTEVQFSNFQEPNGDVHNIENLGIVSLAMDFPLGASDKTRKEIERQWIDTLPGLKKVKALSVRHRVKQDFFEAICEMPNLERLFYWSSTVEDISSIVKLKRLQNLKLWSFTRLTDISPLLSLKNLTVLSIDNCFKVENYEILGRITSLVGLELCGDTFAPKNLRLNSLKPFTTLKKLKHLDLSSASIIDKSYECVLEMDSLERLDFLAKMPRERRANIKSSHKNLKAGFFVDYDFDNHKFYEGKNWETEWSAGSIEY
jgi:Leucine-rich repeat (LRR) protein